MFTRRRLILACCLSVQFCWLVHGTAAEFPYSAKISGRNVNVRSGPGTQYYATDKLQLSDAVEVYRHDPGGWFAVRPPAGSYSWMAGRFLEFVESDDPNVRLAKITGSRVAARVGGTLAKTRDVIAVRLSRGELVEVLGSDKTGSKKWYKIAPPAGEFRWIHGRYIQRDTPEKVSGDNTPKPVPPFKAKANKRAAQPAAEEFPQPFAQTAKAPSQPVEPQPSEFASQLPQIDGATSPTAVLPTQQLRKAVDAIDLDLSRIVAQSPNAWEFVDLQQQTNALLVRCATALDRGHVRLLKNKIDRFSELKRRRDTVSTVMTETDRRNRTLGAAVGPRTNRPIDPRFDGTGILMPVISKNIQTPPFALVDSRRRILSYVSPAPGVNLRVHLGKRVGIYGISGVAADLNKPHLTAKRVTVLEGVRRR